ncbi:hypothetical protein MMC22_009189 [Lobaria immixta]|nr:hypothetical protein [Lobaria immixta]
MASISFEFNVAFTLPVNNKTESIVLSAPELWQGIKRGGRNPNDFADYVASCEVISGNRKRFRRRLILADGAVHTAAGSTLDQDVIIADGLHVEAVTVDTGAKSTFFCSGGGGDGETESDLYLTAAYELKLSHVQANTNAAKDIEVNYTALARGACRSAVEKIRGWKTQGKLEAWQKEDEVLDAADARANTNNAVGAADYAAVDAGN